MADEETNRSNVSSTSASPLQQNEDVGGSTEARSKSKGSQKNKTGPWVKTFYGRNPGSKTAENCSRSEKNIDRISIQGEKVGTISSLTQNVGVLRDNTSTSTSPPQPNEDVGGSTESRSKSKGSHENKKSSHPRVKTFYGRNPGSKASGSYSDVVGGGTHLSSDSRDIGERRNQCDDATCFNQSGSAENADGNPLTPEVGGSTESRLKSKGSHKNKKSSPPRVKTFYGRNPGSKASGSCSRSVVVGGSTHLSSDTRDIGERRNQCDDATHFIQSSSPENADCNPLTPKVGGSTESRSKSKGSHENKKSSRPRVKTFYGRNPGSKASGSCSRSDIVGGSTRLSSDTRDIGERRNQCDDATHFTQSSSPENADGNPLTPELGGSTDTTSKSIGSHENKKSIHPGVKTFYGRNPGSKTSGSCSQSGNNVVEISSQCHKVGGNSSLTQNVGVHSEFSGPQNMHDQTLSTNDHLAPDSGGNMNAGFATVDYNAGFSGVQFPAFPNSLVQTVEGGLFMGHEGLQFADLNQTPSPSRGECFLCHRDLSLPPEDQTVWSALRPVTGVLPCHHHFHAQCLEIITPTDQSEYPPCIQCQVDMQVQSSSSSQEQ